MMGKNQEKDDQLEIDIIHPHFGFSMGKSSLHSEKDILNWDLIPVSSPNPSLYSVSHYDNNKGRSFSILPHDILNCWEHFFLVWIVTPLESNVELGERSLKLDYLFLSLLSII